MINKIENGEIIEFANIRKTFEYIRPLGVGGTGNTHLLKDKTTNIEFAFKKYDPKDETKRDELYKRFVDEVKILFKISHPNIVRIYNYYLYPKAKTGFLQMEYVDGVSIDKYQPFIDFDWNNIFLQVIKAFKYLEEIEILHRDIRPQNILIDKLGNVKIIDFGFGKILDNDKQSSNSIVLNWPVSKMPEEISLRGEYLNYTEIYFVGKLFENILKDKDIDNEFFHYFYILNKMITYRVDDRYKKFEEIYNDISNGIFSELDFTDEDKLIYLNFSEPIFKKILEYTSEYNPVTDVETIIENIANILRKNSLDYYIQNNGDLIKCFINNGFKYNNKTDIERDTVEKFYKWLITLSDDKRVNVVENINTKLSNVKIKKDYDDLPF